MLEIDGKVITESAVIQQVRKASGNEGLLLLFGGSAAATGRLADAGAAAAERAAAPAANSAPLHFRRPSAAQILEQIQPEPAMLPPEGSEERQRAAQLMRLERQLFSAWMQWLTSGW